MHCDVRDKERYAPCCGAPGAGMLRPTPKACASAPRAPKSMPAGAAGAVACAACACAACGGEAGGAWHMANPLLSALTHTLY